MSVPNVVSLLFDIRLLTLIGELRLAVGGGGSRV